MAPELDPRVLLLVAAGGAVGAVLRYGLAAALTRGDFPWGTFAVNFLGSVALGFLVFGWLAEAAPTSGAAVFLGVGLLGAFTTMSTFTVETLALVDEARVGAAGLNVALNGGLCLLGAWLGRWGALVGGA